MNKVLKFSKSYGNILKIKKSFYDDNEIHLKNTIKINNEYKKQPLRQCCKNCGSKKIKSIILKHSIKIKNKSK